MNRLLPHPAWSVILTLTWLLLAPGLAPADLALAALAGLLIPLVLNRRLRAPALARPWLLVPYAGVVAWDVVVASLAVARLVLFARTEDLRPAWIAVPTDLDRPAAVAILAGTITLTPGTLSADVATDGRAILVHCLHAPDPDAVGQAIRTRYKARLKRIFMP